jgi:FkbH-like protein
MHGGFVGALRAMVEAGAALEARGWAQRAVSPLLDYSSLLALNPLLARRPEGAQAPLRLAVLGGPTMAQLRRLVEVFASGESIDCEVHEGEYGLFRQEILDPGSKLAAFRPQVIVVATGARDIVRFPSLLAREDEIAKMAEEEFADWALLWSRARTEWNATIIQNNFEVAPGAVLGHLALRHPSAREHYLDRLNRLFSERAPDHVVLHDQRGLAAEAGVQAWFDPRFYFEYKMPCGPGPLVSYAHSIVSLLRAIVGRSKKVLVLDLDNTVWGGVVGDLGPGGIRVGEGSGEGEAFLAFQRYAKMLHDRGIVLAVCSKNDAEKAREPFEKRTDMVLKLSDFACFRANWENKADNLAEIARRLELKLDSFVFVDDNPAERALVRRFAPGVAVPDLPEDPSGYVRAVALHRYFETVGFTEEDRKRAKYYADNAERQDLQSRAADVGSFLASLGMKATIVPVNDLNIERATQLINKSNQFNLTTRRYTLAQVREKVSDPAWRTLTFSLRDKLGDNGLISVILLRKEGEALEVDTWLMSCRVLQRGVEQLARNELVEVARREGLSRIVGRFVPTAKNGMVERHYANLGFEQTGAEEGGTSWCLRIDQGTEPLSHHIEREFE